MSKVRKISQTALIFLLCALLCSCKVKLVGPAPTSKVSPPAATPTPTPDPWAEFFDPTGPHVTVPDPDKGPWIYKSPTLSITAKSLFGGPRNRQYYVADIYTRGNLLYGGFAYQNSTGSKTELPYLIARRYSAVFGFTADYVTYPSNPKGVMIRDGKVFYDSKKNSTLAVMPDGSLQVFKAGKTTASELLAMGVKNSFSFGPILVEEGKVSSDINNSNIRPSNYRSAIGQIEPGHYICITTRDGFTLDELASLFVDYHCTLAYNMDGGHSGSMIFMGEQLNYARSGITDDMRQRPLPDLVMLGFSASVPGIDAPVYCNGVSIFAKNKPLPTNGPVQ